jgi:hypothetical protein
MIDIFKRYAWLSTAVVGFVLLTGGCQQREREKSSGEHAGVLTDTIVGTKRITNEVAGMNYRKRAKAYFIIAGADTSDFQCIFLQAKNDGRVSIDIRYRKHLSYDQQQALLAKILPFAMRDFNVDPDSLNTIFVSRLITSGDLAVRIAQQYDREFAADRSLTHAKVSSFLMRTDLVKDWNNLLSAHQVAVDTVYTEKNFFTAKEQVFMWSTIKTDSLTVPNQLLDCMIWLRLKSIGKRLA